ncbi:MAG: 23S rRNA (guanosine(2251)-2'-O)-methyltransferase RlmB [Synergistaceae bacterium]|jgi:23S rRNA (guanosine2251-2'-O)-methyltransferase|nr:23S rRNA (guanosine(2251)-2'-O)-methyltransferase RlmB [Synergistaceae bacterium]
MNDKNDKSDGKNRFGKGKGKGNGVFGKSGVPGKPGKPGKFGKPFEKAGERSGKAGQMGKKAPFGKRADAPWRKDVPQREPADDVCWGRQPVLDLVRTAPGRCTKLVIANNVRPPFLDEVVDAARAGKIVYQMVAPEALDGLCPGVRHQGVACRVTEAKMVELGSFLKGLPPDGPALVVVLDHIEDPHNLGAIVRSAEAAGVVAVAYPKRRSALPGGTVMKVSAGAALRVPMIPVVNVARTVEELKEAGFWTVGLDNGAKTSLWEESAGLQARMALVIGAEDEGLSRLVGETCDQLLRIPIRGGVGSLNASVAGALGMFEWSKNHAKTQE